MFFFSDDWPDGQVSGVPAFVTAFRSEGSRTDALTGTAEDLKRSTEFYHRCVKIIDKKFR